MSPQSQTPSQTNGHHNELRGVRTYRGRKLEDLIPQIREELGPDAIILRQREGLTGGVGGFFAQKCVEVDAQAPQPRVDIYDEHDVDQSLLDEIEDPYGRPGPGGHAGASRARVRRDRLRADRARRAGAARDPEPDRDLLRAHGRDRRRDRRAARRVR